MKAALVTGAGCDVGRETSLYLATKGFKVFGHWRREAESFRKTVQAFDTSKIDLEPVCFQRNAHAPKGVRLDGTLLNIHNV